jgi:hypothetical protein
MTRRTLACVALLASLSGCAGGATFVKAVGVGRYPPLPPTTPIGMAATVAELPQPAEVLGDLRLPAAATAESRSAAETRLLDLAAKNGCDAIAEVRVVTPEVATERPYWSARCVRTARAGLTAPSVAAAERAKLQAQAAAEDKARAEAAAQARAEAAAKEEAQAKAQARAAQEARQAAEEAKKVAEAKTKADKQAADEAKKAAEAKTKADKQAADAARKSAQAKAKADKQAADEARKAAETKAKADKQAADEARKAAETKAKADKQAAEDARKAAETKAKADKQAADEARKAAEIKAKADKQAADEARKAAEIKAKADKQAADEARKAAETKAKADKQAADEARKAAETKAEPEPVPAVKPVPAPVAESWVQTELVSISAELVDVRPTGDLAAAERDRAAAGASQTRWVAPRDYVLRWQLRNPTKQPAVVRVALPGGQVTRFLAPGARASGTWTAPCKPDGVGQGSKVGSQWQVELACGTQLAGVVQSVRSAQQEWATDKQALTDNASLQAQARVWRAHPDTQLWDVLLAATNELLRRRSEDPGAIVGRVLVERPLKAGVPTLAVVTLRNTTNRDLTVVFDVGTGRDERLLVAKQSSVEARLPVPTGATPILTYRGFLPALRSLDWLTGVWTFGGATLLLLPTPNGLQAVVLEPGLAQDAPAHAKVYPVTMDGQVAVLTGELPGLFVLALFGDKTPAACGERCSGTLRLPLLAQEGYVPGAGRALHAEVEAGGVRGVLQFAAEH